MTNVTPNCGEERNTLAKSNEIEKNAVKNVKKIGVDGLNVNGEPT